MNNPLISMSVAALLASNSVVAFASSVIIPNAFTAGTTAVAADVNANFNALAVGVNDNDSRITTNAAAIGNNTTNITANTNAIGTNATAIATNSGQINTNTTGIGNNAAAITGLDTRVGAAETAITNLQSGTPTCPSDMVAVATLCVDKYEASLYSDSGLTTQVNAAGGAPYYPCSANGSDCGSAGTPIYAGSVAGVAPAQRVTWHQAVQACANVGKRLPTSAEWQMAAAGTPEGTGDGVTGCNSAGVNVGPVVTGNAASCVSTAGAFDMVGNLWEWTADIYPTLPANVGGWSNLGTATDFAGLMFGEGYDNDSAGTPSPRSVVVLDGTNGGIGDTGLLTTNSRSGFRCVR